MVQEYMNIDQRFKSVIDEFEIDSPTIWNVPDGFISNGATVVIFGNCFYQCLTKRLIPPSVTKLDLKRSFNYCFGVQLDSLWEGLKELCMWSTGTQETGKIEPSSLPLSLTLLDLSYYYHTLSNILPPNLKSLSIANLDKFQHGFTLPESITQLKTKSIDLIENLSSISNLFSLQFDNQLPLDLFGADGMSNNITRLHFKSPNQNIEYFQYLSRNLVDLSIQFLHPLCLTEAMCLPSTLEILKLHCINGQICRNAIPSSVRDLELIFSGDQTVLKEFYLPNSIERLQLYFGLIKQFPKDFNPITASVRELDINSISKDILKKSFPNSITKLTIGSFNSNTIRKGFVSSKFPSVLSHSSGLKFLSMFVCPKDKLVSTMFSTSLTYLKLENVHPVGFNMKLKPDTLISCQNLKTLCLGSLNLTPLFIPSSVTRLFLDLSNTTKLENVIPNSVCFLSLKWTSASHQTIDLGIVPYSVETLVLNASGGMIDSLDALSDTIEYIDFGPNLTAYSFDSQRLTSLRHIKNLPWIQSTLTFPLYLESLHMTKNYYEKNFVQSFNNNSFPKNVPFINIVKK
ncbi:hypothetical protein CYY_006816 [Polysphondylium violaceum]|uniref:Uncharacterized protein n=1 Tax=Polysphondylium violaceum TaxID=133409 RepID=A0A8J4V2S5_9MYCE|nr:hypothetical protein CYY_006816 [Polysphondylium violaceum]